MPTTVGLGLKAAGDWVGLAVGSVLLHPEQAPW